jgi:hypothetical protein
MSLSVIARGGEAAIELQVTPRTATITTMAKHSQRVDNTPPAQPFSAVPFSPGSMVVVTLGSPRDKFWGVILKLSAEGLSISGLELASFEDFVVMVRDGDSFTPAVVFFPMHRIERVELDLPDGSLPSLSQRFSEKTGLDPTVVLSSAFPNGQGSQTATTPPAARASGDPA